MGKQGVLQAPCLTLLCLLWCARHCVLPSMYQTSSPQFLPDQTHAHQAVQLKTPLNHEHASYRKESREIIPQMFQASVRFLPMDGSRTAMQKQSLAKRKRQPL